MDIAGMGSDFVSGAVDAVVEGQTDRAEAQRGLAEIATDTSPGTAAHDFASDPRILGRVTQPIAEAAYEQQEKSQDWLWSKAGIDPDKHVVTKAVDVGLKIPLHVIKETSHPEVDILLAIAAAAGASTAPVTVPLAMAGTAASRAYKGRKAFSGGLTLADEVALKSAKVSGAIKDLTKNVTLKSREYLPQLPGRLTGTGKAVALGAAESALGIGGRALSPVTDQLGGVNVSKYHDAARTIWSEDEPDQPSGTVQPEYETTDDKRPASSIAEPRRKSTAVAGLDDFYGKKKKKSKVR